MAENVWSAVLLWDSPLSIPLGLHFNGSCQKRERAKASQATGKGFLSGDSYVSVHSHILVGYMIHIQAQ